MRTPIVPGLALVVLASACTLNTSGVGTTGTSSDVVGGSTSTTGGLAESSSSTGGGGGTIGVDGSTGPGSESGGEDTTTGEGSGGSSETGDQPQPPPGPYTTIAALDPLNENFSNEDDPTLRQDELEIYFASDRLGDEDIYVSTRLSTAAPFGPPVIVNAGTISTFSQETTPELSHDGLLLLFASDRSGNMEVYYTTRGSFALPWGVPQLLPGVGSFDQETAATPQADATTLLWCSDRQPTMGGADLWQATIDRGGVTVTDPFRVLELSTTELDCPGNSSGDMTWQLLESGRAGTMGGHDIWYARRTDAGYDPPVNLPELNTGAMDGDPWVTDDLERIYFSSNRAGDFDLYVAQ